MEIGSRDRFSIQWELDKQRCGPLLFGKICFWVDSKRIGDYELGTSLMDVFISLAYPVGDCGDRASSRFCGMSGIDAFSQLHQGLFESSEELRTDMEKERWARFNISLPVDVFDGYRIYLIDCHETSRLLVSHRDPDRQDYRFMCEQALQPGEFDVAIRELQKELEFAAIDVLKESED